MLLFPERLAPEEIKYSKVIGNSIYQEFQYRRGIPFFGWVLTFFDISAMFCSLPHPIPRREEMKPKSYLCIEGGRGMFALFG